MKILLVMALILSNFFAANAFAGQNFRGKISDQIAVFKFVEKIFDWILEAKSLQVGGEGIENIALKFETARRLRLREFFLQHNYILDELPKLHYINRMGDVEIIPEDIYSYIVSVFAVDEKERLNENILLIKLIGGRYVFANKRELKFDGLIGKVDNFKIKNWKPIERFLSNFRDTVALDSQLSSDVTDTMKPLLKYYFDEMDSISRVRLLRGVLRDLQDMPQEKLEEMNSDALAVTIFQNTGPILVKLLQKLNEEVHKDSSIGKVLEGIEKAQPMDYRIVKSATEKELKKLHKFYNPEKFKFRKDTLGIASIAQTHMFKLFDEYYVVKVHKKDIEDIFRREKDMLLRLVSKNIEFDKGMKQKVQKTSASIEDEMDFRNERRNIVAGYKVYVDESIKLTTINIPFSEDLSNLALQKTSEEVLFMTLASGRPLSAYIKNNDDEYSNEERIKAFEAVKRLYNKFLTTALGAKGPHFYHGDLHRGNVFYDKNSDLLTMIDFGNASYLENSLAQDISNIITYTQKSGPANEEVTKKSMQKVGSLLQKITKAELREQKNKYGEELTDMFFSLCFNPNPDFNQRSKEGQLVAQRLKILETEKNRLQEQRNKVNLNLKKEIDKEIELVEDNMAFVRSINKSCISGTEYPINVLFAAKSPASMKLDKIFSYLERNGITMPKEIIFFNRSKDLLEDIIMQFNRELCGVENFSSVYPDVLFTQFIKEQMHGVVDELACKEFEM